MNNKRFCIYEEIFKDGIGIYPHVKSYKLRWFINTYGVNKVDDDDKVLLDYVKSMNRKQIDMILIHKPNIVYVMSNGDKYIPMFGHVLGYNMAYVIRKMVEYDHDFLFVSCKINSRYGSSETRATPLTFLEWCKRPDTEKNHKIEHYDVVLHELILFLENHLKQYESLSTKYVA